MVLTASGWFVSQQRLIQWAKNHPKWPAEIRPDAFIRYDLEEWFNQRWRGSPILPIIAQWPKPNPTTAGEAHLMIVSRLENDPTGTRETCKPVPKRQMDEDIEQLLLKDGLESPLTWITIPDPYEHEPYGYDEMPPENDTWAE